MSTMTHYRRITSCRSCASDSLEVILELGETPLADQLIPEAELHKPDLTAPLTLGLCTTCGLVQILETVDPHILFGERYVYYSSVSPVLMQHTERHVEELFQQRKLNTSSLVIELASNDGYLLKGFMARGVPVLGIDPAPGPVAVAREAGVPTLQASFELSLAEELATNGRQADVLIANNVLAHVDNVNGFVAGMALLIKQDGVIHVEVPYLVDLLDKREFDTIYHQHLCYFTISSLDQLFRRHGLYLNEVHRLSIHGGSLRLTIEKSERVQDSVSDLLRMEDDKALKRPEAFTEFVADVQSIRYRLRTMLGDLKRQGCRVGAYGAAAKGTTLLSYCGIDDQWLDYVVDLNEAKQGRYLPGQRLLIQPVQDLLTDRPDYVLLLAWNFADEILAQQESYLRLGGRFIIPIPQPRVVTASSTDAAELTSAHGSITHRSA